MLQRHRFRKRPFLIVYVWMEGQTVYKVSVSIIQFLSHTLYNR